MKSLFALTRALYVTLIAVTVMAFAGQANAEPQKPAEESAPAQQPEQPQKPPMCYQEYIVSFVSTARLINASAPYFEAGEVAPSLPETAFACHRFNKQFPDKFECLIPQMNVIAKSEALRELCGSFIEAYTALGGSFEVKEVTNQTPLGLMEAKSIRMTLQDSDSFAMLFVESLKTFAVDGKILKLMDAVESSSNVRCGAEINNPLAGMVVALQGNGQIYDGVLLYESFVSGVRAMNLVIANGLFSIVCTKTAGGPITYGDLKKAFGPILKIEYLK